MWVAARLQTDLSDCSFERVDLGGEDVDGVLVVGVGVGVGAAAPARQTAGGALPRHGVLRPPQ